MLLLRGGGGGGAWLPAVMFKASAERGMPLWLRLLFHGWRTGCSSLLHPVQDDQPTPATRYLPRLAMQTCFPPEVWQPMKAAPKSYPVSCAGTVLGPGPAVLQYVRTMVRLLAEAPPACRSCSGCDQGVHNYLLHVLAGGGGLARRLAGSSGGGGSSSSQLSFNVTAWPQCTSPIYTMLWPWVAGMAVQMVSGWGAPPCTCGVCPHLLPSAGVCALSRPS